MILVPKQYGDKKNKRSIMIGPLHSIRANRGTLTVGSWTFMGVFGLFWSSMTIAFDCIIVSTTWNQLAALSYPTAPGEIISSKIAKNDGDSQGIEIRYKFNVGGKEFTGDKYRYGETRSNDGWAKEVVAKHSPKTPVTVFYNPRDPSDAVLMPGIEGVDLFLPMFMTPFNMVMLGIWAAVWQSARDKRKSLADAGGLPIEDRGVDVRVRMAENSPLIYACVGISAAAFVMVFVIGFSFGSHAPLAVMMAVWVVILAIGAGVYIRSARPLWNGSQDLTLNLTRGIVTLPATFGRKEVIEVKFADITGVAVNVDSGQGRQTEPFFKHEVTLYWRNDRGSTDSAQLYSFFAPNRAESFAEWLRKKIAGKLLLNS